MSVGDGAEVLLAGRVAAFRLLSDPDRRADRWDILLATAMECLHEGPHTSHQLTQYVQTAWPGVHIAQTTLDSALTELASGRRLVACRADQGEWELTDEGRSVVLAQLNWATDQIRRCEDRLREQAAAALGPIEAEQAQLWTRLVIEALHQALSPLATSSSNGVVVSADQLAFPEADFGKCQRYLEERVKDAENLRFLIAMARSAFDPAQPFWNEIIHNLTVGFLLYGFFGRRDDAAARSDIGTIRDEVLIIDTPILLRLLGSRASAQSILDMLSVALTVGVTVVVHGETLSELDQVLDRHGREVAPEIEAGLGNGAEREVLARIGGGESDITWIWLTAEDQAIVPWVQFRARATQVKQTLQAIGVQFPPEIELHDMTDVAALERMKLALTESLKERGQGRGQEQIRHDALLLLDLERRRKNNPPVAGKIWPGAFVVTPDSHLTGAYRSATGSHCDVPAALPVARVAGIVAEFADPPGAEKVAEAISRTVSVEVLLGRAARLPVDAAVRIARGVVGDAPPSPIEVQLTFDDIVAELHDLTGADAEEAHRLAREVIDLNSKRRAQAAQRNAKQEADARARAQTLAEASRLSAEQFSSQLKSASKAVDYEREGRKAVDAENQALKEQVASTPRYIALTIILTLFGLVVLVLLVMRPIAGVISALGLVVAGTQGVKWARDGTRPGWLPLASELIIVVFTVIQVASIF